MGTNIKVERINMSLDANVIDVVCWLLDLYEDLYNKKKHMHMEEGILSLV